MTHLKKSLTCSYSNDWYFVSNDLIFINTRPQFLFRNEINLTRRKRDSSSSFECDYVTFIFFFFPYFFGLKRLFFRRLATEGDISQRHARNHRDKSEQPSDNVINAPHRPEKKNSVKLLASGSRTRNWHKCKWCTKSKDNGEMNSLQRQTTSKLR